MDKEVIVAIIAVCGVLFTNLVTYMIARYNFSKPKAHSILAQQLDLVFTPIHQIIFYDEGMNKETKIEKINNIIKENYSLVAPELIKLFKDDLQEMKFAKSIDDCYNLLRRKLGYSKIKYRGNNKTKKLLANQSQERLEAIAILSIISWVISFIFSLIV